MTDEMIQTYEPSDMDETLSKCLEWSGEWDHKVWDSVVPPENIDEIFNAIYYGSKSLFIIAKQGMGKDALKHYIKDYIPVTCVEYTEEEIEKAHSTETYNMIKKYMMENNYWKSAGQEGAGEYEKVRWFKKYYEERYKTIEREALIYPFLSRQFIIKISDNISKQLEFDNQIKVFSKLYETLRECEELFYQKRNMKPTYKLIFILPEEYTGAKLEKISHIQLTKKSKVIFIPPYSVDKLLEIYRLNIHNEYLPFNVESLTELANASYGNPRNFKKLIFEHALYMEKEMDEVRVLTIDDINLTKYKEKQKINQEMMELNSLYSGYDKSNARINQYYPRVKRIMTEHPEIEFKTQPQILAISKANYGEKYLDSRKISNALSPINQHNNMDNEVIKYKHLIYRDVNKVYRYDS